MEQSKRRNSGFGLSLTKRRNAAAAASKGEHVPRKELGGDRPSFESHTTTIISTSDTPFVDVGGTGSAAGKAGDTRQLMTNAFVEVAGQGGNSHSLADEKDITPMEVSTEIIMVEPVGEGKEVSPLDDHGSSELGPAKVSTEVVMAEPVEEVKEDRVSPLDKRGLGDDLPSESSTSAGGVSNIFSSFKFGKATSEKPSPSNSPKPSVQKRRSASPKPNVRSHKGVV
jgi:hypothetical protein